MKIEITKATIVQGYGPDVVLLETTLPESTYPFNGVAILRLDVAADKGPEYVSKHFDLISEVIRIPSA